MSCLCHLLLIKGQVIGEVFLPVFTVPQFDVVPDADQYEIVFQVAGTGTMNSVSRFLFQIEKSTLHIRLTDVQLGSREEDGNDLSLQLRLSALYLSGKVDNDRTSSEAGSAAGGRK